MVCRVKKGDVVHRGPKNKVKVCILQANTWIAASEKQIKRWHGCFDADCRVIQLERKVGHDS